ncbi:bifunctional phosphopantothenoylcysteine decarboxylase/phosphopantothenate--cysteine ligase CoaBC [Pontimonas sp.]|nr:bifunctional phosphopantothenoylcysteine decarboxylase/phosphopantothenate--cysteine ligase CoaBC [Pontimonas sp.]MDB4607112.1 bifunctional phosphopantothenoylcysteine decarboxylase/phosphopantothenate--cysteine ligase CoaBC [Pontimonas sp.]
MPEVARVPRIVVGVAGGIAAYKSVSLVREFVKSGADVTVIPTESALKFVGRPTWEAVSRNEVSDDLFDDVAAVRHVALGQSADVIVIAPATAHTVASLAAGLAGNLLGTTVLASSAPLVLAPAMHTEMWDHPSVRANIATLLARGATVVGPETGELTGGDVGAGRMSEPHAIAEVVQSVLVPQTLAGRRVVISAGGTREPLDPVRFIGNRSSGEMGVQLAVAARARGAEVTLVAANLEVPLPTGVTVIHAPTAVSMRDAMQHVAPTSDVVIMAAAVADWVAAEPSQEKLKKTELGQTFSPVLHRAPDILAELGASKAPGQLLVGFSAETAVESDQRDALAREKLGAKNVDVMCVNQVGDQLGFGDVETIVTMIHHASPQSRSVTGSKHSVAGQILDALLDR